jgi:hypothetical protein
MKTVKFFSVLSLVLIFAGVNAVFSGNRLTSNTQKSNKAPIRYEVNIHLPLYINLCSTYLVVMTDEAGRHVAHAQVFDPAIKKYVFVELASVPGKVRIASLVLSDEGTSCPITLITKPDVKTTRYLPGYTYSFDLYPIVQKEVIKEENMVNDDLETGIDPLP